MKKCIICLILVSGLLGGCTKKEEINVEQPINSQLPIIGETKSGETINTEVNKEIIKENQVISGENTSLEETSGEIEESISETENIVAEIIPTSTSNLSNKTNAWGFVRKKDNVQPEFSSQYTKVLDNYEGIYVGNSEEKKIYLTFDEGYENGYTDDILDTLKEKEVTAVFFVTMPYVKQNADLVQRMIDEGHIVGNHISRTSMYHIKIS